MQDILDLLTSKHNEMRSFAENEFIDPETMADFAEWAVSASYNAIQSLQDRLHLLVTGNNGLTSQSRTGLLVLIANHLKVSQYLEIEWISDFPPLQE